jgi:hypothetical protein
LSWRFNQGFENVELFGMSLLLFQTCARFARRLSLSDEVKAKVREVFAMDLRALALFRACLGVLVAVDVCLRLGDLNALYTDQGFMLAETRRTDQYLMHNQISIHRANSSALYQFSLFALQFVAALALAIGYRTRAATVVSFFLLASLHTYVPVPLNGGDDVMRVFLLWSMFLPLGRRWSVDAALRGVRDAELAAHDPVYAQLLEKRARRPWQPSDDSVCGLATVAFKIQLLLLYVFAAALKTGDSWANGDAVHYSLYLSPYITELAVYIRDRELLCRVLTHATMWLEVCGPLLYFSPFATAVCAMLAAAMFIGLHLSFLLILRVGLFSCACASVHLAFLPGELFDFVTSVTSTELERRAKVVYDVSSSHAALTVRLLQQFCFADGVEVRSALTHDQVSSSRLSSAHPVAHFPGFSEHLLPALSESELRRRDIPVAILEASGRGVQYPGDANRWRLLAALTPLPRALQRATGVVWRFLFDSLLWDEVVLAQLRADVAAVPPRRLTATLPSRRRVLANVALSVLLFFALWSNLNGMFPRNDALTQASDILRVNQYWHMFAPEPPTHSAYYLMVGELVEGKLLDFDNGGPVPTVMRLFNVSHVPDVVFYESARWRRVLLDVMYNPSGAAMYARWLCRQWNRRTDVLPIKLLRFTLRTVESPPPGFRHPAVKTVRDRSDITKVFDCAAGKLEEKALASADSKLPE